jgi:hypothetical protein
MCAYQGTEQGDVQRGITANFKSRTALQGARRLTVNPVNHPEWNPGEWLIIRILGSTHPCWNAQGRQQPVQPRRRTYCINSITLTLAPCMIPLPPRLNALCPPVATRATCTPAAAAAAWAAARWRRAWPGTAATPGCAVWCSRASGAAGAPGTAPARRSSAAAGGAPAGLERGPQNAIGVSIWSLKFNRGLNRSSKLNRGLNRVLKKSIGISIGSL